MQTRVHTRIVKYTHTVTLAPHCAMIICVDGHHKLVRWRLVTRCGIDGYTRAIVYVQCSSNNRPTEFCRSYAQMIKVKGDQELGKKGQE